jgi:hypothetical protein
MAIRCASCDREVAGTPAPGTPCPTCGAQLVPDAPLEVDPVWAAERAAKQATAAAPVANKGKGSLVVSLVLLVMVGVFIVMVLQRQPTAKGTELPDGIELTITSPKPVAVTIDGAKAGRTPLSLKLKGSTRVLKIEGNGVVKEIRADRDQVVNLVK